MYKVGAGAGFNEGRIRIRLCGGSGPRIGYTNMSVRASHGLSSSSCQCYFSWGYSVDMYCPICSLEVANRVAD